MTIEKNYIVADDNKLLHRKETDVIVGDVFLGKYDSLDNWEEITKEEADALLERLKQEELARMEEEAKAEEAKAKAITVESNSL